MNKEITLQLQAHVDGELDAVGTAEIQRLIETQPNAKALCNELRSLREVLLANEETIPVPASREFYWSRISQGIEKAERSAQEIPAVSIWTSLVRWLVPVGSALALMVLLFSVAKYNGGIMTQVDDNPGNPSYETCFALKLLQPLPRLNPCFLRKINRFVLIAHHPKRP